MESTNKSNQLLFMSELKELRNEISDMKKRIDQLENSHQKQQETIDILERENRALKKKTQPSNFNGNKAAGSVLKRKRTEEFHEKEKDSKCTSVSVSAGKKKPKTNNNKNNDNDDNEAVMILRYDNGDSFDSLSDDLLHKIVEFDGNCYEKFGSINKRCRNIYDVKEYKLKKQTYVCGYGTIDMMLQNYLQDRREGKLDCYDIADAAIMYNRLDAIEWIIQLGDIELLKWVCYRAASHGRINILTNMFLKSNVTMLDDLLDGTNLCWNAARFGKLETLKWVRKYGAKWNADTFSAARENGHDEIIQYLHAEGCPEPPEDGDESLGSE